MNQYQCPHCKQTTFTTLCSDCLAEEIPIEKTRASTHVGTCHRCGHVDDEPCMARVGASTQAARAWDDAKRPLQSLTSKAYRLASRAAGAIRSGPGRSR